MPYLCDVNFLIALSYGRHQGHSVAKSWLEAINEPRSILVCRTTQMSVLRLLTTAAVMGKDVCTRDKAWAAWDALLEDFRLDFCPEPEGLEISLRALTTDQKVSPKLWQDDYLAAFAMRGNLALVTFDRSFCKHKLLTVELVKG